MRGQMKFIPDWDCFIFLGTPMLVSPIDNKYSPMTKETQTDLFKRGFTILGILNYIMNVIKNVIMQVGQSGPLV